MINNLKLNFENEEFLSKNYSQSGQDLFVLMVTNGKKNGVFLDIGAHHPIEISNTYLLEKKFGWTGHLIEIEENFCKMCREQRTSELICNDATKVDYDELFKDKNIDYLSLDIDGQPSLDVLKKIPFDQHKISVITFEHDSYRVGDSLKNESRDILKKFGYVLLCSDVSNENNIFEDWYVHPELIEIKQIQILESNGKNWNDIIFKKQ